MQQNEVWYFAYGSNLYIPQMLARIGKWKKSRKALLRGWKLVFNVHSQRWGGGTTNIIETKNSNDMVYGAIYLISRKKLDVLSTYEKVRPKVIIVESEGKKVKAKTFIFREDKPFEKPQKVYVNFIIDGLRQHGYEEDVIENIRRRAENANNR